MDQGWDKGKQPVQIGKRDATRMFYDRRFQIWEYRVSHQQLLIRSPKSQDHARNLDLIFVGVDYLALPKFMDGISIVPPDEGEMKFASAFASHVSQVIVLETGGKRHLVIAAKFRVFENDLDLFESSLESFNTP